MAWHSTRAEAHHYHHGHDGFILNGANGGADLTHYELNNRTANGQLISIAAVAGTSQEWRDALDGAVWNWNVGIQGTTGFGAYSETTGGVTLQASYDTRLCPNIQDEPLILAHGCVLNWYPNTPSGLIYMQDFGDNFAPGDLNHRVSDAMHEMGHVLYYAGEHYGTSWNCSSIMGHCNETRITTVQPHDIEDYKAAFEVREGPDAAYMTVPNISHATHSFEGGYLGSWALTSHQEKAYWIDISTSGPNGPWATYVGLDRIVNNDDNGDSPGVRPHSWADTHTYPLPWPNAEWCFTVRGESGGVDVSNYYRWGPRSKAYCVSTAFTPPPGTCGTSSVITTTDRNGNVYFRVYNFSGSTISNVTVTKTDNSTLCALGNITSGNHKECNKSLSASGTVRIYYNNTWGYCDSIKYGG